MKHLFLIFVFFVAVFSEASHAQEILPKKNLYTLDGQQIAPDSIINDSLPVIMVFWKMYDRSSCRELTDLNDLYIEKLKDKKIKVVSICIDNTGSMNQVKPFVYGYDLKFEVYIDKNSELKRAMSIPALPFTIIFDGHVKKKYQYSGYYADIDNVLLEKINVLIENSSPAMVPLHGSTLSKDRAKTIKTTK